MLALVAAFEVRVLRMDDVGRRLRRIAQQIHGEDVPRSLTTGFYFDPGYADFLTEITRRTPRDATVAVLVPTRPDLYRYQAVYLLAPRRVVVPRRLAAPTSAAVIPWRSLPLAA